MADSVDAAGRKVAPAEIVLGVLIGLAVTIFAGAVILVEVAR